MSKQSIQHSSPAAPGPVRSRNPWLAPGFVVAVAILAVAAVGLNAAVSSLQLHFKKLPVPLSKPLATLPPQLGNWVQVSIDQPLDKEVQDALATDNYIFRDYVNRNLVSADTLAQFNGQDALHRRELLARLQMQQPAAVMNMAVTYYTGLVDTVAHIPDRCMIADGFEPSGYETMHWDLGPGRLGKAAGDDPRIAARYISFEDQTAAGRVTRRVGYFFFANGQYESDPLAVRQALQNLRYRHGFYSKVELMSYAADDDAQRMMVDFLRSALPQVEQCWPDWNRVENAKSTH